MSVLEIDIWSDVMCPWCAIGYTNFAAAVERVRGDVEVDIRWMPFELNPGLPLGGKSQAAHLAQVYDKTPEDIAAMAAQMADTAREAGFSMDYTGEGEPPEPMMWNTFGAHCLLRWALKVGGPDLQTRLKLALFEAHFQKRLRMDERDVLLDIAESLGMDRDEAAIALAEPSLGKAIRTEEQRAAQSGITSVPTFVINGQYMLQGSQSPEAFARALQQLASMVAAA